MPTAFPYIRVSHKNSAESGLSAGAQLDVCRNHYGRMLVPHDVVWWGLTEIPADLDTTKHDETVALLYDPAVSARHVPFLNRKGGIRLNDMLQPGDHVIFAHLDRGFRAVLDHAALIDLWKTRHITVHFADLGVDLSTPHGMLVANIMAAVAQGQSDMLSERNKEIAARMRKLNRPCNGHKRLGYKLQGKKPNWQWVPDMQERAIMAEIVRLRDEKRTWWEVSDAIEEQVYVAAGKIWRPSRYWPRNWSCGKCQRALAAWQQILEDEGGGK